MVLAISYIIFTLTFILKLLTKRIKFFQNSFHNNFFFFKHIYWKKFFYNVNKKKEYKFIGFSFKDLYKVKKYSSLALETTCVCILVFIKNYVHINLQSNLFKPAIWVNFILIKNKNKYFNQTYLLGSSDSLTFFSTKLNLTEMQSLVYNYPVKINAFNNTIVKNNFKSNLSNSKMYLRLNTFFIKFFNLIENKITFESNCLPTSIDKFSDLKTSKNNNILFLRKSKIFNKGRYSRNRQYYRTGVYWCIYINVILIIGLYFWFYRFTMNFSYMWWALYLFLGSFIFVQLIRLKLHEFGVFSKNLTKIFKWTGLIFRNIFKYSYNLFTKLIFNLNKFYYISYYNTKLKYIYFTELFIYPIIMFFIQIRKILLIATQNYIEVKYTYSYYQTFDYYYLHQNRFFFIKSFFKN